MSKLYPKRALNALATIAFVEAGLLVTFAWNGGSIFPASTPTPVVITSPPLPVETVTLTPTPDPAPEPDPVPSNDSPETVVKKYLDLVEERRWREASQYCLEPTSKAKRLEQEEYPHLISFELDQEPHCTSRDSSRAEVEARVKTVDQMGDKDTGITYSLTSPMLCRLKRTQSAWKIEYAGERLVPEQIARNYEEYLKRKFPYKLTAAEGHWYILHYIIDHNGDTSRGGGLSALECYSSGWSPNYYSLRFEGRQVLAPLPVNCKSIDVYELGRDPSLNLDSRSFKYGRDPKCPKPALGEELSEDKIEGLLTRGRIIVVNL